MPLSRRKPKELLPFAGRPLLEWVLEELRDAGIRRMVVVVRPDKPQVRRYLEGVADLEVRFAVQDRPRGLADALRGASSLLAEGPFLLIFPDQLLLDRPGAAAQMLACYPGRGSLLSMVRVPPEEATWFTDGRPYAVRGGGRVRRLAGLDGPPTPRWRAFGRLILEPAFFHHLPQGEGNRAYREAVRRSTAEGEHHVLMLEGRGLDLGTLEAYRYYCGCEGGKAQAGSLAGEVPGEVRGGRSA